MIDKTDAAEVLKQLARKSPDDANQPRVIMVRASRETKSFVGHALESLEELSQVLRDYPGSRALQELQTCFEQLSEAAQRRGLKDLSRALDHSQTLILLLVARLTETTDAGNSAEQSVPAINALLKYFSTALLRIYVEGHDRHCGAEFTMIRKLVQQASPHPVLIKEGPTDSGLIN